MTWRMNSMLTALFLHFSIKCLSLFPPSAWERESGLEESALSGISCHRPFECIFTKSFPSEGFSLDSSFLIPTKEKLLCSINHKWWHLLTIFLAVLHFLNTWLNTSSSDAVLPLSNALGFSLALKTNPLGLPPFLNTWIRSQIKT